MNTTDSSPRTGLTTIYLIRHGESLDNAGIPYKRTPEGSPLTERGRQQAHEVAARLADIPADAVIASDLIRARQTAEIIALDRHLEVRIIPELQERSIGIYGGRADLHEAEEFRDQFAAYHAGTVDEKMRWKLGDEWESLHDAQRRFVGALEHIVAEYRGRTVIIVAHGTVMRTFLMYAEYGAFDDLGEDAVANTGYAVIETDGRYWKVLDAHGVSRRVSIHP